LELNKYASEGIKSKGYDLLSDFPEENRSGILSFGGKDTAEIYDRLIEKNIIVSFRKKWIRVAPHFYNVRDDIDRMLELL
jgi:selenocysteine lyase/cysteine desulfurase